MHKRRDEEPGDKRGKIAKKCEVTATVSKRTSSSSSFKSAKSPANFWLQLNAEGHDDELHQGDLQLRQTGNYGGHKCHLRCDCEKEDLLGLNGGRKSAREGLLIT